MKIQSYASTGSGGTVPADMSAGAASAALQPASPDAEAPAAASATPERVRAAVGAINKTIQSFVSHLEFSVDPDTKVNVVKVIDTRTHEVLRQFPSEEVLSIAKALDQFKGLLLRDQA